jgi:hypothetical protein
VDLVSLKERTRVSSKVVATTRKRDDQKAQRKIHKRLNFDKF